MSHPSIHEDDGVLLKPRPRRPFELSSTPSTAPPTPPSDTQSFQNLTLDTNKSAAMSESAGATTPSRTKSLLNLTASTLFGIYQPSGMGTETANPTPWGTGAQTPAESRNASYDFTRMNLPDSAFEKEKGGKYGVHSAAPRTCIPQVRKKDFKGYYLPLAGRTLALFAVGMLYGLLVGHLHDKQKLAPAAVNLDRGKWAYLVMWGCIGAVLGNALPLADVFWAPHEDDGAVVGNGDVEKPRKPGRGGDAWMDVVRSIGAFVGIAFAIRKLPWQSTMQLCLTLALANPAVWYLIDRSPTGFIMSTLVAVGGTAVLFGINPALVPSPSPWQIVQGRVGNLDPDLILPSPDQLLLGIFSQEVVGVATWIASVLFVSCVCFGNIGRRLGPQSSHF